VGFSTKYCCKLTEDSKMKYILAIMLAMIINSANANEALAQKSGCLACHNVNVKILGPAYKDVAAKYRGQAGAEAKLVAKVKAGGSGVWGPIPMPAHPQVKEEDIRTIVKWVLTK
jgi:cytochrome c